MKYKYIPGYPRFTIEYTNYMIALIRDGTSDYNNTVIDMALNDVDKYYTLLKYGYVSVYDYMRAITTALERAESNYNNAWNMG